MHCPHEATGCGSTEFAEQAQNLLLITTRAEVLAFRREGFQEMQALVFPRRTEQFTVTKRASPFAHNPGPWCFSRAVQAPEEGGEPD